MNNFDAVIETWLTRPSFGLLVNHAIKAVADLYMFKGLVLIPILWWIWFRPGEHRERQREMVIATIMSGLLALAVGRLLADLLPFRVRPIQNPDLHLHFPFAAQQDAMLTAWSSFPSDHAMLWMSVATGIFIVWRGIGVLALLYTAIFICLPRAYLGYHYPTDILAGAAIGIAITFVMTRRSVRARYATQSLRWIERYPGPSAMLAFVLCLELVTQFDELRKFVSSASRFL